MKNVILSISPKNAISIDSFNEDKLYFSKTATGLYKLHEIDSKWAFVSMSNSGDLSTGWYLCASEALKYQLKGEDVCEFDNLREAMEKYL